MRAVCRIVLPLSRNRFFATVQESTKKSGACSFTSPAVILFCFRLEYLCKVSGFSLFPIAFVVNVGSYEGNNGCGFGVNHLFESGVDLSP